MENFSTILQTLSARHQAALTWFADHRGRQERWPSPLNDGTLLVSKAKGIYKPEWMDYALSIRQSLDGPYPDRDPIYRSDGTWVYQYFQENDDIESRDKEYTNRGLVA